MKQLFIEMRKKTKERITFSELDKIKGKTISLASTIQYLDFIPLITKHLEKIGKKVLLKEGASYKGHVIGCNSTAFDRTADSLLLLADGKFHGMTNALLLKKEINIFNLKKLERISPEEIEREEKKIMAKQTKFLSAKRVGVILSTKPGQHLKNIEDFAKKLKEKEVYLFESDNIDLRELDNFPDIHSWINTACYGLGLDDSRIINTREISELI
jgi:diphthamide biosynthesis enzyme Dph1/Dph2-like protein